MPDPIPALPREFLRRKEAANFIGMSVAFLRKAEREGRGPHFARLGRTPAYAIADLRAWVESRREHRTSPPPA